MLDLNQQAITQAKGQVDSSRNKAPTEKKVQSLKESVKALPNHQLLSSP